MRESTVERRFVRAVRELGGVALKLQGRGNRGMPDRVAILPGAVALVELKAPGRRARPEQVRAHARLRKLGHRVDVLDSVEAVQRWATLILKGDA